MLRHVQKYEYSWQGARKNLKLWQQHNTRNVKNVPLSQTVGNEKNVLRLVYLDPTVDNIKTYGKCRIDGLKIFTRVLFCHPGRVCTRTPTRSHVCLQMGMHIDFDVYKCKCACINKLICNCINVNISIANFHIHCLITHMSTSAYVRGLLISRVDFYSSRQKRWPD